MNKRLVQSSALVSALALSTLAGCKTNPLRTPRAPTTPVVPSAPVKTPLSHNAFSDYQLGNVDAASEDVFGVPRVKMYDANAYAVGLTGPKGEVVDRDYLPAVSLIPSDKARISVTQVGIPGGKVVIDSPAGENYVPYVAEFDLTNPNKPALKVRDLSAGDGLARLLVPSMSMPEIKNAATSTSNLALETITEANMPFVTQTLGVGQNYVVFPMSKDQEFHNTLKQTDVLPFYFVRVDGKEGFQLERNGTSASNPTLYGHVVVFKKGDVASYVANRGLKPAVPGPGHPGAIGAPQQRP
ncbi:MAG: hypothetical protein AABW73_04275 [Nanoarchaeota archaeon]